MQLKPEYYPSRSGYIVKWRTASTKKWTERVLLKCDAPSDDNFALASKSLESMLPEIELQIGSDLPSWCLSKLARKMLAEKKNICETRRQRILKEAESFDRQTKFLPVSKLTAQHLSTFPNNPEWNDGNRHFVGKTIKCIVNHFVKNGQLAKSPFASCTLPPKGSRTMECMIQDEEWAKLVSVDDRGFVDACLLLEGTGARPSEILEATCEEWDDKNGLLCKSRDAVGTKRKEKQIVIPARLQNIIRTRLDAHKTGFLFPEFHRTTLAAQQDFYNRWSTWRDKSNISPKRIPYGLRHRFAVAMCRKGVPIEVTAALMGHADTTTVRMVYGHVAARVNEYRQYID